MDRVVRWLAWAFRQRETGFELLRVRPLQPVSLGSHLAWELCLPLDRPEKHGERLGTLQHGGADAVSILANKTYCLPAKQHPKRRLKLPRMILADFNCAILGFVRSPAKNIRVRHKFDTCIQRKHGTRAFRVSQTFQIRAGGTRGIDVD